MPPATACILPVGLTGYLHIGYACNTSGVRVSLPLGTDRYTLGNLGAMLRYLQNSM